MEKDYKNITAKEIAEHRKRERERQEKEIDDHIKAELYKMYDDYFKSFAAELLNDNPKKQ